MNSFSQNSDTDTAKKIKEVVSPDGQAKCILCFKKNQFNSFKMCQRCSQLVCKECFKIEKNKVTNAQKSLFNSNNIGRCCFSDLIFQNNILSDVTKFLLHKNMNHILAQKSVQWGKDSQISQNWTSNSYLSDSTIYSDDLNCDDSFLQAIELANTKYKDHAEIQLIEKDIFDEDIFSRKNFSKSFAEFFSTLTQDVHADKIKQDLLILLKSFIASILDQRETPQNMFYQRGHGILGTFLLFFCSIERAFFVMKEIYSYILVEDLLPDQIKKSSNLDQIIKYIVFTYLENFQVDKNPTPSLIQKVVSFTRKYLIQQYNYFFLNQLNFSSSYVIISQLLKERTHEVLTRGMASVIQMNLKIIQDFEIEANLKEVIYNKVQPETLQSYYIASWGSLSMQAKTKIVDDYFKECEREALKNYNCGAETLRQAVKDCLKKQKNRLKILEEHYQKELLDTKRALAFAMKELSANIEKIQMMEIEKNNQIIKYESLQSKFQVNQIEYEDIQSKLEFLVERAGRRQMHYNKEYEEQVSNLQQQVKNYKLDIQELELMHQKRHQYLQVELEEKNTIIKRLKEVINFLNRSDESDKGTEEVQKQLSSVIKEKNQFNREEIPQPGNRLFMSYAPSRSTISYNSSQISSLGKQNSFENNKSSFLDSRQQQNQNINQFSQFEFPSNLQQSQEYPSNNQGQFQQIQPKVKNGNNIKQMQEQELSDLSQFYSQQDSNSIDLFNSGGIPIIHNYLNKNHQEQLEQQQDTLSQSVINMYKQFTQDNVNSSNQAYLQKFSKNEASPNLHGLSSPHIKPNQNSQEVRQGDSLPENQKQK